MSNHARTPSRGTPSRGNPFAETSTWGTPSAETPSAGILFAGTPFPGSPSAGSPSAGTPSRGVSFAETRTLGTPSAGSGQKDEPLIQEVKKTFNEVFLNLLERLLGTQFAQLFGKLAKKVFRNGNEQAPHDWVNRLYDLMVERHKTQLSDAQQSKLKTVPKRLALYYCNALGGKIGDERMARILEYGTGKDKRRGYYYTRGKIGAWEKEPED